MVVLAISFVLALRSMEDYHEIPQSFPTAYSLFLVRKPEALTPDLINKMGESLAKEKLILSFERLFKGGRRALVVFGPVKVLQLFSQTLNLLELEDYSQKIKTEGNVLTNSLAAWEVGTKGLPKITQKLGLQLSDLRDQEEFWWQLAFQPAGKNTANEQAFKGIIRVVLQAEDHKHIQQLQEDLSKVGNALGLVIVPRLYSTAEVVKFYQQRALPQSVLLGPVNEGLPLVFNTEQVLQFLDLG